MSVQSCLCFILITFDGGQHHGTQLVLNVAEGEGRQVIKDSNFEEAQVSEVRSAITTRSAPVTGAGSGFGTISEKLP